jgi:hypothetical protein
MAQVESQSLKHNVDIGTENGAMDIIRSTQQLASEAGTVLQSLRSWLDVSAYRGYREIRTHKKAEVATRMFGETKDNIKQYDVWLNGQLARITTKKSLNETVKDLNRVLADSGVLYQMSQADIIKLSEAMSDPSKFENFARKFIEKNIGAELTDAQDFELSRLSDALDTSADKYAQNPTSANLAAYTRNVAAWNDFTYGQRKLTPWEKLVNVSRRVMISNPSTWLTSKLSSKMSNYSQQLSNRAVGLDNLVDASAKKQVMTDYINSYNEAGISWANIIDPRSPQQVMGEKKLVGDGFQNIVGRSLERGLDKAGQIFDMKKDDNFNRTVGFIEGAGVAATTKAKAEGLKGEAIKRRANELFAQAANPITTDIAGLEVRAAGVAAASIAVGYQDSAGVKAASAIRNALDKLPIMGGKTGTLMFPFIRNPINYAVMGVTDYSPVGLGRALKAQYDIGKWAESYKKDPSKVPPAVRKADPKMANLIEKAIKAGDTAQADSYMAQAIANASTHNMLLKGRGAFGSAVMLGVAGLAATMPEDYELYIPPRNLLSPKEIAYYRAKGYSFNSINLFGLTVSLDYFGYLGAPMRLGFSAQRAARKGQTAWGTADMMAASVMSIGAELPIVTGMAEAAKRMKTTNTLENIAKTTIDYSTRVLPPIIRNTVNNFDDYERDTRAVGDYALNRVGLGFLAPAKNAKDKNRNSLVQYMLLLAGGNRLGGG